MKALTPTNRSTGPLVSLAEVEEPTPQQDEALIEVEAFSVNRGETFLLESPSGSWRPGRDVAGRVIRAAEDGSGPQVGERVVGHPASHGWAERAAVPTPALALLPDDVDSVTAAALPLAVLTALRLLRVAGPLSTARLLVTGASGGVGHYVVELAAAQGADITAVTASAHRGARLLELGATHVVDDIDDAPGAFDVAFESVGGDSLMSAWKRLKVHGLLLWFGQASRRPPEIDFFSWEGATSGTIRRFDYTDSDHTDGEDLETLTRLVASGRLHPEIGKVARWTETSSVIDELLSRKVRGNAVLTLV